jgi:hypothetical protein
MNFKINLAKKLIFMQELFGPQNPFVRNTLSPLEDEAEDLGPLVGIQCNTDFESIDDENWFYSEVTFEVAGIARIVLRCEFLIDCDVEFGWGNLYQHGTIDVIIRASIEQAVSEIIRFCKESNVEDTDKVVPAMLLPPDDVMKPIYDNQIDIFFNSVLPFHEKHQESLNTTGMVCPPAINTELGLNVTFLIIDQVIYSDMRFNRQQNRKVFFEYVPEIKFNTMKLRSGTVRNNTVTFNEVEVTWLLRCMDCATQLMLGDYGDRFIPICEDRGINEKLRSMYFKSITEFFNSGPHSTSEIYDNHKPVDWNRMIW